MTEVIELSLSEYLDALFHHNNKSVVMLIQDLESTGISAKERKIIRQTQDERNQEKIHAAESLSKGLQLLCLNSIKDLMKIAKESFQESFVFLSDEMRDKLDYTKTQFYQKLRACRAANRADIENTIQLDESISAEIQKELKTKYKIKLRKTEKSLQEVSEKYNLLHEAQHISETRVDDAESRSKVLESQLRRSEALLHKSETECNKHKNLISILRREITESKETTICVSQKNNDLIKKLFISQLNFSRMQQRTRKQKMAVGQLEKQLKKKINEIQELEYKVNHMYDRRSELKSRMMNIDENSRPLLESKQNQKSIEMKSSTDTNRQRNNKKDLCIKKYMDSVGMNHLIDTHSNDELWNQNVTPNELTKMAEMDDPYIRIRFLETKLGYLNSKICGYEKQVKILEQTIQEKDNQIKDISTKLRSSFKQNEAYGSLLNSKNIGRILAADRRLDTCFDSYLNDSITGLIPPNLFSLDTNYEPRLSENKVSLSRSASTKNKKYNIRAGAINKTSIESIIQQRNET